VVAAVCADGVVVDVVVAHVGFDVVVAGRRLGER